MPASQTEKRINKRKEAVQVFAKAAPQLEKLGPKAFRAKVKGQLLRKFGLDSENPQHIAQVSTLYNHAKRTNEDAGVVEQFGRTRKPEGHVPAEGDTWQAVNEDGTVVASGRNKKTLAKENKGCTIEAIAS